MKTFPPKAVTVAKWEAEHPEYFEGLRSTCDPGCHCRACFQQALDRLVSKTEATANACGISVDQHDDLASYLISQRSGTDRQYTIQHGYGSSD